MICSKPVPKSSIIHTTFPVLKCFHSLYLCHRSFTKHCTLSKPASASTSWTSGTVKDLPHTKQWKVRWRMFASVQNGWKVSWCCLVNTAVLPCFSSLDLKRKGIGNLFSVQTVPLGRGSRNNAGILALCVCSEACRRKECFAEMSTQCWDFRHSKNRMYFTYGLANHIGLGLLIILQKNSSSLLLIEPKFPKISPERS